MQRTHKALGFLLVILLGVYGCAKGPVVQGPGDSEKTAQAKVIRLEEDHRAAVAVRDQFRQKLLAAEEQQARLRQELEQSRALAARDRDALNAQLRTRTLERDNLQVQYDGFRKNIKELIGQAESALLPSTPATVVANPADRSAPARN